MPTFLHAADLHIDSPLRGLDRKEGAPAQRIRGASRIAFTRMVDAAIEQRVAFVLLAGDIYDSRPAFETYLFFHQQMDRLSQAGIPVAIVLGNHDHDGASPRAGRLPEGIHVMPADKPASLQVVPGVWVHGQSFPTRDIGDDLTAHYPQAVPGALNIGLLHTALDGYSGEHARYAPSNTQRLAAHGYAYWALGHVHASRVLNEQGCHIVYPGNLQGRHPRETGPKGAMFVDFAGTGISAVRAEAFDDVRWFRMEVDAGVAGLVDDMKPVVARMLDATSACRNEGRLAAVRLRLQGAASPQLMQLGEDEIRASLRAAVSIRDDLFLEKIELDLHLAPQDQQEVDHYLGQLVADMTGTQELEASLAEARQSAMDALRKAGGPELVEAFKVRMQGRESGTELAEALPVVRQALTARTRGGR